MDIVLTRINWIYLVLYFIDTILRVDLYTRCPILKYYHQIYSEKYASYDAISQLLHA